MKKPLQTLKKPLQPSAPGEPQETEAVPVDRLTIPPATELELPPIMKCLSYAPLFLLVCLPLHGEQALPLDDKWYGAVPMPPGVKVRLRLPETVVAGQEIPAALVVTNAGKAEFTFTSGGDYRGTGFPLRMKVRVHDAAGQTLLLNPCEAHVMNGGGLSGFTTVQPGESREVEFPLDCYVSFLQAGAYTVTAGHDLGWKLDDAHPHPVAQAKLNVTLPTEAEAAAYVDSIFARQPTTPVRRPDETLGREMKLEKTLSVLRHPVYLAALKKHAEAGSKAAVAGIGQIATAEATEVLLALLKHASAEVAESSAQQILRRMAMLDDPNQPYLRPGWRSRYQIDPLLPASWDPRFEKTLVSAALAMLSRESEVVVGLAGQILEARGMPEHAPAILAVLQKLLDTYHPPRSGAKVNTLDPPAPQRTLMRALDALRKRGWRGEESGGGTAAMVARFRQLADPDVSKPTDESWRTSMLVWVENGPATLKICALEAIPEPMSDEAAKVVMNTLNDRDWGVMRVACEVAGKSKRPEFAMPLVQIVEIGTESFLQRAAIYGAWACGARMPLWEALATSIADEDRMVDVLRELIVQTIDLPTSTGGGGNSNFTRDQRFAIRAAWRSFLQKHRTQLAAGKKVSPPDTATTAALVGANFDPQSPAVTIRFKDGTEWPPKRKK
jgi:hypothetical protein